MSFESSSTAENAKPDVLSWAPTFGDLMDLYRRVSPFDSERRSSALGPSSFLRSVCSEVSEGSKDEEEGTGDPRNAARVLVASLGRSKNEVESESADCDESKGSRSARNVKVDGDEERNVADDVSNCE